MGDKSPFLRTWSGATAAQREISAKRTDIYIAKVRTQYLRPISKEMAARQHRRWSKERPVNSIATGIRNEFTKAFQNSSNPHYRVVNSPTPESVTLEISLLELDPTSVSGNALKKGASMAVGPLAGLIGTFTGGAIAIEGRLIDTTEKWSLFEFADREKDKMTFWTLRDFKPYGHSDEAIKEWASQFEETTRNPDWREMGDARIWTLRPW